MITVAGAVFSQQVYGEETFPSEAVAILFELKKPFLEAVEGLNHVLETGGVKPDVFTFDDYSGNKEAILKEKLLQKPFRCYVGVGPQAAGYLWTEIDRPDSTFLCTMVLNPEKILPPSRPLCGVSLNLPIQTQVQEIAAALPAATRIGLLFDPRYNEGFFYESKNFAERIGREIVPMRVASARDIPDLLERSIKEVDTIWMIPDPTVISESIIQYITKQALMDGVPIIGYNTFFFESGAVLNFIFNYRELGEQTGELVLESLKDGACRSRDPRFRIWVNRRVAQMLGIVLGEEVQRKDDTEP